MEITLAELAQRLNAQWEGGGEVLIRGVAGLAEAREGDLSFVSNPKYAASVAASKASAVIVGRDWARPCPAALLRVAEPDVAFALAAAMFAPPPPPVERGVHPTAVVSPEAQLGPEVGIGPHVVIEAGARIGARTVVLAGGYIGHGCVVGEDSFLYPHVSLRERCVLGNRVILHNGVVVGSDGFGYSVDKAGVRTKIPQSGVVVIGDDVEIGANTTIDRARFGTTRIGNGVKIDNLVQIGHNVVLGDHVVIVAQVGVAGSSEIGPRAILAGQVGVAGHVTVGAGAVVGAQSGVPNDIPPGVFVVGSPPVPRMEFARNLANVSRLPQLKARVAELEKRLAELEKKAAE